MKTLFKILVVLVIVLAIVLVVGIFNLDKGIKAAVETAGPKLTQSKVTLAEVNLSLTTGEGSLKGLVVGNPAGFKTKNAFSLGKIALAVDTASVTSDTIVINTLHIIAPKVTYESGKGGSNIDQLQRNVESALGTKASTSDPAAEETGAGKKLIIRDLQITDGSIIYSNPLLANKSVTLPLPPIRLTGIGEKSNGATAAEVTKQVLAAINKNAIRAISNSDAIKGLGDDVIEQGKSRLEESLGGFKGLLNKD